VNEYLNFVCDLKGVKKEKREAMLEDIKKTVKIKDVEERLIKNLSKGYRQRVGLAQALVGYPDVIILDEPTVGLDPKQIIEMRDLIKKLGEKHTIIISSHILSEVSAVCNRVMIINKGKLVALEDAQSISEGGRNDKQVVTLRGDYPTAINALLGNAIIENVSMQEENREKLQATVLVEGKGDIREQIFLTLVKSGVELLMIKPATPSLEDVFMQVINGSYENKEIEMRAAENITAKTEITETAEKEEAEN
jgi:ABC-2 type transport system ATP-binding protein